MWQKIALEPTVANISPLEPPDVSSYQVAKIQAVRTCLNNILHK